MTQALSATSASDEASRPVECLLFAPEAIASLRRAALAGEQAVNPGMLCGRQCGSLLLTEFVVPFQTLRTHQPDPTSPYTVNEAVAWWAGYRAALERTPNTSQFGWWIQYDDAIDEHLVLSASDVMRFKMKSMWHIKPRTYRSYIFVLFTTARQGTVFLRAYSIDASTSEVTELNIAGV